MVSDVVNLHLYIKAKLGKITENGIGISFTDTAVGEESFEFLRTEVVNGKDKGDPEAVVQISNDLRGCGRRFNSISFTDSKGAYIVGSTFRYEVLTKFPHSKAYKERSATATYTVPWYAPVQGVVEAVGSGVGAGVANVRICVHRTDKPPNMEKECPKAGSKEQQSSP